MSQTEKMPNKHDLSGVYIRFLNPVTGQYENRVFEDLPEQNMRESLDGRSEEWLREMVVIMAKCLHTIADEFEISAHSGESDL